MATKLGQMPPKHSGRTPGTSGVSLAHYHSTPCGMGMADGAWGWHGGTYQALVVVGSCGCETRGGEGGWVKNPKPSHRGSVSGCNGAAEGGGGCCGVTVPPLPC
jgi:hypothetical protein